MRSCCCASPLPAPLCGCKEGAVGRGGGLPRSPCSSGAGLTRSRFAGFASAPAMGTVPCLTTAKHSNGTAVLAPVQGEKNDEKSTWNKTKLVFQARLGFAEQKKAKLPGNGCGPIGGTIMNVRRTPAPFNRERFRQCCSGPGSQGASLALLSPKPAVQAAWAGQEPQCCLFCPASCAACSALASCSPPWGMA